MFVARKRLKVSATRQGEPIYREYGDVVPEAESWDWKTQEAYIRSGHIERQADPVAPATKDN